MSIPLLQISPRAWEHPTDRAALGALRAIPALDELVRSAGGFISDHGVRRIFLGGSSTVTVDPGLDALLTDVCTALDCTARPELKVMTSPRVHAFSVGFDNPVIVISTAALERYQGEDERRALLAREVSHVMSGHMTYHTMAMMLVGIGAGLIPSAAGVVLLPFALGLLEWHRASQLSADRAALLAVQHLEPVARVAASLRNRDAHDTASIDDLLSRARATAADDSVGARLCAELRAAFSVQPTPADRVSELEAWKASGAYDAIIAGTYPRRGEETEHVADDLREAARRYDAQARAGLENLRDAFDRSVASFRDAFRTASGPDGPPGAEPFTG